MPWSYRSSDAYYYRSADGMFSAVRDGKGWVLDFLSTDKGNWPAGYLPHHTKTVRGAMRRIESLTQQSSHGKSQEKPMTTDKQPSFAETAILVSLSIKTFGGAADETGKPSAKSSKKSAPASLEPVKKAVTAVRTFHYDNTLPWLDEGMRVLPSANYEAYKAEMEKHKDGFDSAVRNFCDHWPETILAEQSRLGDKFRADDYPVDIRERFSVVVKFSALDGGKPAELVDVEEDVAPVPVDASADGVAARMAEFMGDAS